MPWVPWVPWVRAPGAGGRGRGVVLATREPGERGDRGIMGLTARQNTENRTRQHGKLHLRGLGRETTLPGLPYLSLSVDRDERESEGKPAE